MTISAEQLREIDLPPVKFIVENFLPQGLAVLASPPKYGKSWFVLDLCLSVASGEPFLNRSTEKCGTLYLALEDSFNRLKDRLDKVLSDKAVPKDFDLSIKAASLSSGLIEQLEKYLEERLWVSLIVIDTLQKVRDIPGFNSNIYAGDYCDLSKLKTLADKYGICILLVHHLRKGFDTDVFNRISGSNGIVGSADTIITLSKSKRTDTETTLSITGRDVEESELLLKFDKATCLWRLIGEADTEKRRLELKEYQANPVVQTIKALLKENPDGFAMTTTAIQDKCLELTKTHFESVQSLGVQIRKIAHQLHSFDRISYKSPSDENRSHGERRHTFSYKE